MSELPDKRFLRRGEVQRYLGGTRELIRKFIEAGLLTPIYLGRGKKKGRALFERGQVLNIGRPQQNGQGTLTANQRK